MQIRPARDSDLPAIAAIYNHEVLYGTATFDTEPVTLDERRAWLQKHESDRHPAIVADVDGDVAGWGALSAWSERCAYARAAEVSVYVHQDHRGRGVGKALLASLIDAARGAQLGVLLARITCESHASLKMHRAHGFTSIGTMRRVGEKHGRILDVELLELHVDAPLSPEA